MSWTQADLDAINQAMATGAMEVRFADGRLVKYRSLAEMRSIRDEIASAIGAVPESPRTTYASFSRF